MGSAWIAVTFQYTCDGKHNQAVGGVCAHAGLIQQDLMVFSVMELQRASCARVQWGSHNSLRQSAANL